MNKLIVRGTTESSILIGESFLNFNNLLPNFVSKVVIITDTNLFSIYGNHFQEFEVIVIGTGEGVKTFETIQNILDRFLEIGVDRSSFIVGIGGGIVSDITGFAASIFMRGITFGFVATSLLAMVDAAIGGKNGINLYGYKNLIGTINQPKFVICDYQLLRTLPKNELRNGMAELIKTALIADIKLFEALENKMNASLNFQSPEWFAELIFKAVTIKVDIVNQDEKETGIRKNLNFGHTFGHAIEKHSSLSHGEAVSIGMAIASSISEKKGLLSTENYKRIIDLLEKTELPVKTDITIENLMEAITKDKKKNNNNIELILLSKIGKTQIHNPTISELKTLI